MMLTLHRPTRLNWRQRRRRRMAKRVLLDFLRMFAVITVGLAAVASAAFGAWIGIKLGVMLFG